MNTMRDYQRQKNNKYILPRDEWHRTLWTIRGYYRIKEEAEAVITGSGQSDGMTRGTDISDPTAKKAINLERDLAIINLIETEKSLMPEPYQTAVWNNIQHGMPYPLDAGAVRETFSRWKSKYVFRIAEGLKKI